MVYLKLILLFSLLAVLGGGYAYHQVTVSNLESQVVQLEANNRTLKENQVQMETAVRVAQESLAAAEANAKKSEAAMSALTARNNELQREKDNAMKIFKDHNLTRLARAKPGMIETRANAKTESVFRELENDTKELMDADDTPDATGVPNAEGGGSS
jgi:chromosome segregation ATPase